VCLVFCKVFGDRRDEKQRRQTVEIGQTVLAKPRFGLGKTDNAPFGAPYGGAGYMEGGTGKRRARKYKRPERGHGVLYLGDAGLEPVDSV